jgi:murein DD-endopeptidase MepM/ murein hydrolase activator NlpD
MQLRLTAAIPALLAVLTLSAACAGGDDSPELILMPLDPTEAPSATLEPVQAAAPGSATSTPPALNGAELRGFVFPIVGACLPTSDLLMPGATREYRQGIHEGVDFYQVDNCTAIGLGTPVVAVKAGKIIRIDSVYTELTALKLTEVNANPRSPEALDTYRGRQVWVDHGGGVVTRYCHLSGVADGLRVGDNVAQGQTIAYVGESGTPESVSRPGGEYHLHFEVRIGSSYLGQGEAPAQVRAHFRTLFAP